MTKEEEVLDKYKKMEEMFGSLPSWEQEPIQFEYLVKLYIRRQEALNEWKR